MLALQSTTPTQFVWLYKLHVGKLWVDHSAALFHMYSTAFTDCSNIYFVKTGQTVKMGLLTCLRLKCVCGKHYQRSEALNVLITAFTRYQQTIDPSPVTFPEKAKLAPQKPPWSGFCNTWASMVMTAV